MAKSTVKIVCPACDADAGEDFIILHNGINQDGRGFVHMAHGRVQFTPEEARTHALRLLECAEAAESDQIVLRLLKDKIGLDFPRALHLIAELRHLRDYPKRK